MHIGGLQKLTLLDFPERAACIVFTAGCNLRCPFCHNAALVTHVQDAERVEAEEVLRYLQKRKVLLDGVVITGGEPLLQEGLADFIRRIKAIGHAVKLDTNGCFPDRLEALLAEGLLDYVAMDIKNSKAKYAQTAGVPVDLAAIERSMTLLRESGVPYEFRTTVADGLHTVEDIREIARWIAPAPRWYLQNFVDSGDLVGKGTAPVSSKTLQEMLKTASECGVEAVLRGS